MSYYGITLMIREPDAPARAFLSGPQNFTTHSNAARN